MLRLSASYSQAMKVRSTGRPFQPMPTSDSAAKVLAKLVTCAGLGRATPRRSLAGVAGAAAAVASLVGWPLHAKLKVARSTAPTTLASCEKQGEKTGATLPDGTYCVIFNVVLVLGSAIRP